MTVARGLKLTTSLMSWHTRSVRVASPASTACARCGITRCDDKIRFTLGTGLTGTPSVSTDGLSLASLRRMLAQAMPLLEGDMPGSPGDRANHMSARMASMRTHWRMPWAHTMVDLLRWPALAACFICCKEKGPF